MRRTDREIKAIEDVIQIVKEENVCRIAMTDGDYPYILPLNYGLKVNDEEIIFYFHSAMEGRKMSILKKNGKVAFEIDRNHELTYDNDKGSCSMLYECVTGIGDITFVEDINEKMAALRSILTQCGRDENFKINEAMVNQTTCYKLTVKEISGKKH